MFFVLPNRISKMLNLSSALTAVSFSVVSTEGMFFFTVKESL